MSVLPAHIAFNLWDTYGFPLELTQEIGRERGFEVDIDGFRACMEGQKARSRKNSPRAQSSVSADRLDQDRVQALLAICKNLDEVAKSGGDIRTSLAEFNRRYNRASACEQGEYHRLVAEWRSS